MFGYLRETEESAIKAGVNKLNNINRTGLDTYLKVIFPNISDWIHDAPFGDLRIRPDYRSDSLKLIVEFDGVHHYQNPEQIQKDYHNTQIYEKSGYKVIRIPFFIQLSSKVIKHLFNVDVNFETLPDDIISLDPVNKNTPAYLCVEGIERMKNEFIKYSYEQYMSNLEHLKKCDEYRLCLWKYLC